jgi:hypothetical protein
VNAWYDPKQDDYVEFEPAVPEVDVSDNPVVAELLGPDGQVLRRWCERPPFGFRAASQTPTKDDGKVKS